MEIRNHAADSSLDRRSDGTVATESIVTMQLQGQMFGASVRNVQDVVRAQKVERLPLAPYVIEGAINLRGRIVRVVNMYKRLGLPLEHMKPRPMHVVIEDRDELFSLMVDSVGDVLTLPTEHIEKVPVNISYDWRDISCGVYRLESHLLVLFDIDALLDI